jgi:hypothetical protein
VNLGGVLIFKIHSLDLQLMDLTIQFISAQMKVVGIISGQKGANYENSLVI